MLAVRMWGTAAGVLLGGAVRSAWGEVTTAGLTLLSLARTTLQPFSLAAAWLHHLILPLLQVSAHCTSSQLGTVPAEAGLHSQPHCLPPCPTLPSSCPAVTPDLACLLVTLGHVKLHTDLLIGSA